MLPLLGSQIRIRQRSSRRTFLALGSLGAAFAFAGGLSGHEPKEADSGRVFGRAKRCILLFLTGGPPQHDTWDMKPRAAADIRGEFSPIDTNVPGIQISELFPLLA